MQSKDLTYHEKHLRCEDWSPCSNPNVGPAFYWLSRKAAWLPDPTIQTGQGPSGLRGEQLSKDWATALFHRFAFGLVCL